MTNSVTLIVKGSGLKQTTDGGLSGIQIFEREYSFDDPIEFGQFLGPKLIADKVDIKEDNIRIPHEARYTWSVKRVEGVDPELYQSWAEEFASSDVGSVEMTTQDVLQYWLQRTQDEDVINALNME